MNLRQGRLLLPKILIVAQISAVFFCLFLLSSTPIALAAPGAPSGLTVDVATSPGSAILSWTAPGSGDPVNYYRVYRSLNEITDANRYSAELVTKSVTGTTYTDSRAIRGETYYWAVSAVNVNATTGSKVEGSVSNSPSATVGLSQDPHSTYSTSTSLCRDCHDVHGAVGATMIYRRATQKEVCYTCHDGSGSSKNIRAAFGEGTLGSSTKVSYHPVPASVSSRGTITCLDCHAPHRLEGPRHTAPGNTASNVLRGTWGVEPNPWPTPNVQPRNIPAYPGTDLTLGGGVTIIKAGNYFYAASGGGTTYFWRYNPSNNAWQLMANSPSTFTYGAALVWTGGDYIYAFQGGSGNVFMKYQISTDTWNPGGAPATPPGNVSNGGSLVWTGGNFIYATAGGNTTNFWRYKISTNTWNPAAEGDPADPTGAVGPGGSLDYDGTYIWCLQGNSQTGFYRYTIPASDTGAGSWTSMSSTLAAVAAGGSLCYPGSGDYIYALQGNNTTTFWAYSKTNNNWTAFDPPNTPTAIGSNVGDRLAYDGSAYIYCLEGNGTGEFWRYKISTNLWNDGQAAPSAYTVVNNPAELKEYQLCLKCHSNYSGPLGAQPAGQMNLAVAINPMTASHHPIAVPGANRYADQDTMESPWNQYDWDSGTAIDDQHSLMYCSDCHGSNVNDTPGETNTPTDPTGPHGSNQTKILRATIASDATNGTPLCYICHKKSIYWDSEVQGINGTRFSEHPSGKAAHKVAAGCLTCHIGGSGVAGGRATSYREYIHGSNLIQTGDAANKGPAHAFLYGDGMEYVRQADASCWVVSSGYAACVGQHLPPKTPVFFAP